MAGSEAENDIWEAVVQRLRTLLPTARIIHELNVEQGTVRADIAAVSVDTLYLFELKSARDKLHRLPAQIQLFRPVCHGLVVVADKKWCGGAAGYPNCDAAKIMAFHHLPSSHLWRWPEPADRFALNCWRLPRPTPPWGHRMLRLLWADELRQECRAAGLAVNSKTTGRDAALSLAHHLTGADLTRAVCRQLRQRTFAQADEVAA